ncbi:MAG: imidazole glycerol phosphate synthase subunit HisH [Nitrospirae bacterium CG_4_10_14_0_8_um_filter_41_23]|nr:imidazole glycerol phosphate synthase subunit HisH [Nitrospirota bacterium]OIP58648.1 MAG: imidazole glycerol phosphate synthase subunit HisH [Nitrospirae bacterium CG2_30_41_42]PIQ93729.1 MAG: imidazole glycerol phosphate synthase subunit HisH [Nitrospirae bacterium CG11_big_fil_rev_8_21_14_0_20_41_14]PIV42635.1 MAG: imidazole glycerol phosphate synthase subunit HisH [Nitrospirae bacterium CG02_land_8_20_14_3_00_41_53]PIW87202.1 MAG: imidazole glycerol phosphate synthase subunit HisH [Nitro
MIAIVDYGMGNLRSVEKGFLKVGLNARVVSDPRAVDNAQGVVLPGVGAFRDCMKNLKGMSLIESVVRSIRKGKPYLGICLGLQVLFTESEEFGIHKGFDILKGKVVRFQINLKVPHMGWNNVKIQRRPPIFDGIQDKAFFYFVHSFYVVPDDNDVVATTTDYGITFASMVWKENIFATQFHPEKSQETGLRILKNFGDFVRKA